MAGAAARHDLAAGCRLGELRRAGPGYHDRYVRVPQQMLRDTPYRDQSPRRAQDDETCLELSGNVQYGTGDMTRVDVPDQAARLHSSAAQFRDDLIDLAPAVGSAVLGHHRGEPRDGGFTYVQDDDLIRAVPDKVPCRIDGASAMRDRLGGSEINGEQNTGLRIPGHRRAPIWC